MHKRLLVCFLSVMIYLQSVAQEIPVYFKNEGYINSFRFADREPNPYSIVEFSVDETDTALLKRPDLSSFTKVSFVKLSFFSDSTLKFILKKLALLPALKEIEILEFPLFPSFEKPFEQKPFPDEIRLLKGLEAIKFSMLKNYDWNNVMEKISVLPLVQLNISISYFDKLPGSLQKLKKLRALEVSGNNSIVELPEWLKEFKKLNWVSIGGNQKMNCDQAFKVLAETPLRALKLTYQNFDKVPAALAAIKTLEEFSANSSVIKNADSFFTVLSRLPALKKLSLNGGDSIALPASIGLLNNLEVLTLNSRKISSLPSEIGNLQKLNTIALQGNRLKELPETFYTLQKLKWADLSYNNIAAISPTIGVLKEIEYLNLTRNQIDVLPPEIGGLFKCKILNVSDNLLAVIPESIGSLRKLEELAVSGNILDYLLNDFSNLKYLKRLEASNNRICNISPSIGKLPGLQQLLLDNNLLERLPDALCELRKLKELNLSFNILKELPENMGNLFSLESLSLLCGKTVIINRQSKLQDSEPKANSFTYLPASLSRLRNIKNLWLNNNVAMNGDSAIRILLRMQSPGERIDLTNTNIHSLPENGWDSCKFSYLDLSNNHITKMPEGVLKTPPTFRYFRLNGNQLPALFNRTFESKEQLLITAVEAGMLKDFSMISNIEALCKAFVEEGNTHYYYKRFAKALSYYLMADSLCPANRTVYRRSDYFGIALYQTGKYAEAIPVLSQYLQKDTAQSVRILNFIDPAFQALAGSYLAVHDTMNTINTFKRWSDFSHNSYAATEAASLMMAQGNNQESMKWLMKSATIYRQRKAQDPLELLSILEVFVMAGRSDSVSHFKEITDTVTFSIAHKQLYSYLLHANDILTEKMTNDMFDKLLSRWENIAEQKLSWSYDLFESWFNRLGLNDEKKQKIRMLTNAVKKKLHN